jgi:glycosyltransferase involved in cell wall biosynthesis
MNLPKSASKLALLVDNVDDYVLHYWREVVTASNPLKFLILLKAMIINYFFERKYLGAADMCVMASEVDAKIFSRICPKTPLAVVNNGVDSEYFQPLGLPKNALNIVFEGSIDFEPNKEGVLYFCRKILPIVHKSIPNVKFTIVGKNPPPEIKNLNSAFIEVTGYVDDIRPYLDRAALFVCPLRKGAGTKNKILQAWAMEKSVVATTLSIGGLLVKEGENILIRDKPKDFANAVIDLIRNPEKTKMLGMNARKNILENYIWERKALELEELMKKIAK